MEKITAAVPLAANLPTDQKAGQDTQLKELRDAAEQFEALFMGQFMQAARKSQLSDGLFQSDAGDTYTAMLDQKYATEVAGGTNLGIADALVAQFSRLVTAKQD